MKGLLLGLAAALGCTAEVERGAPQSIIHARFDPQAGVLPMPTDILRDGERGRLDVPLRADLTGAERQLYEYLNTRDGWSTAMPATLSFTGPVAAATVNHETVQVWHLRATPEQVDVAMTLSDAETELTITPPREGWERAGRYVVVVRGGLLGVEGKRGEPVEADAAFHLVRLREKLDSSEYERTLPGATAAERMGNAEALEEIRESLQPHFDFFAERGIPRDEVAALWAFTITEATELATDRASERIPLPIDVLLDPDDGRVDLPVANRDSELVASAKQALGELDGFGVSGDLLFGFTGKIDPSTLTTATVELLHDTPLGMFPVEIEVKVFDDAEHVAIRPRGGPLQPSKRYVVVLSEGVRDAAGEPISLMPAGALMNSSAPLVLNGASQVDGLALGDARRLEAVRGAVEAVVASAGRPLAAWSFTTQSTEPYPEELLNTAQRLGVDPDPTVERELTPLESLGDFPLGISSLVNVERTYYGTLQIPELLDPRTRAMREDGGHRLVDARFVMTVPKGIEDGEKLPVVMFTHGLRTESRFVLAIGDALAHRGYAVISLDLPYHGERSSCYNEDESREAFDPQSGELAPVGATCADGATCSESGLCEYPDGSPAELDRIPVLGMYEASGVAYVELEKVANTADHIEQSLIDMRTLHRSLLQGDWKSQIGYDIDTADIQFTGASLGGVLGATYLANTPGLERAVLTVPGANVIGIFTESDVFKDGVIGVLEREGTERGAYEAERLLTMARWISDRIDPQSYGETIAAGREVLIQMGTLDTVIPNEFTEWLTELSGASQRDYVGTHGFIGLPVEPAYHFAVEDLADHLAGWEY